LLLVLVVLVLRGWVGVVAGRDGRGRGDGGMSGCARCVRYRCGLVVAGADEDTQQALVAGDVQRWQGPYDLEDLFQVLRGGGVPQLLVVGVDGMLGCGGPRDGGVEQVAVVGGDGP